MCDLGTERVREMGESTRRCVHERRKSGAEKNKATKMKTKGKEGTTRGKCKQSEWQKRNACLCVWGGSAHGDATEGRTWKPQDTTTKR